MRNVVIILFLICFSGSGLWAKTAIQVDEEFIHLLCETEPFRYYKTRRSYDLEHWSQGRMPIFLGKGGEMDIVPLIRSSIIELTNIFFKVEAEGYLTPYNRFNHAPILLLQLAPNYPSDLKDEEIEGSVTVVFTVGTDGRVEDMQIEESTDERFNQEVLFVLSFWRFMPAKKDGEVIAVKARQTFPFKISS